MSRTKTFFGRNNWINKRTPHAVIDINWHSSDQSVLTDYSKLLLMILLLVVPRESLRYFRRACTGWKEVAWLKKTLCASRRGRVAWGEVAWLEDLFGWLEERLCVVRKDCLTRRKTRIRENTLLNTWRPNDAWTEKKIRLSPPPPVPQKLQYGGFPLLDIAWF